MATIVDDNLKGEVRVESVRVRGTLLSYTGVVRLYLRDDPGPVGVKLYRTSTNRQLVAIALLNNVDHFRSNSTNKTEALELGPVA